MLLIWHQDVRSAGSMYATIAKVLGEPDAQQLQVAHSPEDVVAPASRADGVILWFWHVDRPAVTLVTVAAERCPGGVVVIAPASLNALRPFFGAQMMFLLLESEVTKGLRTALTKASLASTLEILLARVNGAGLPFALAGSIRHVLRRSFTHATPVWSVRELSKVLGCSPRHLRKQTALYGLDLVGLIADCRLLAALRLPHPRWSPARFVLILGCQVARVEVCSTGDFFIKERDESARVDITKAPEVGRAAEGPTGYGKALGSDSSHRTQDHDQGPFGRIVYKPGVGRAPEGLDLVRLVNGLATEVKSQWRGCARSVRVQ